MADDALAIWRDKLEHLQKELAKCSDPSQKFSIKQEIKEAKAKIAELEKENQLSDDIVKDVIGNYQTQVRQSWDARWSEVIGDERPPFIAQQTMRLLLETEKPQRYLRAEYFRSGRMPTATERDQRDLGEWIETPRDDVAANRVSWDGTPCDLSRMVLTTDAGVGKTTNLHWLHAELNGPGFDTVAILIDNVGRLPSRVDDVMSAALVPAFRELTNRCGAELPDEHAMQILRRLQHEGRLVLLLDALDQAPPDGGAVETLASLLGDPAWQSCRIVLSGRPHALRRHWHALFDRPHVGWRFLVMDDFNEDQQRQYLGIDEDGDDRYERIPAEARDILATPRVLEYLRELPTAQLRTIKTASDVYWRSINHLLKEGMMRSETARRIGLAANEATPDKVQKRSLRQTRKLLGAIAFEMTSRHVAAETHGDASGSEPAWVPNFDRIDRNEFETFKAQLLERLSSLPGGADHRDLERDLDCLEANEFLLQDVFEPDLEGLDQILWRNRTLQEFFTAFWLSQYCTLDDADSLWDWVYLPAEPISEEYYWVWRLACEMPEEAQSGRLVPGDGAALSTR